VNILYIYQGDWPHAATRVAKQVRSLARAGHNVHLLARNYTGAPRRELWESVTVHRLPWVRTRRLNRVLNFPVFVNPMWLWAMWRLARRTRADRIVVADLPLAPAAIWLGRLLGIPVHYDMAEVYPEFLKSLHRVTVRPLLDRVIRSPGAAAVVERYVLRTTGSTTVVSEESRLRCVRLGARAERVALVGNTPDDVSELTRRQPFPPELQPWAERRRALFVGTLIADRGVKEVVEALALVVSQVPDAALVIVGDGPDRPRIAQTVERLGLGDHVALLGWRDHGRLAEFYQHCQVGLLPFLDTPHVRVTLANKLFDYMGASLAVLAADLPPMRRVLEETGAGVLYPVGNTQALAEALVNLLNDRDRCRVLGAHGREAVLAKYHWGQDEVTWLSAVGALERPVPASRPGARSRLSALL
jgi:glycosyltransferase involved in cell wall biosynthesis